MYQLQVLTQYVCMCLDVSFVMLDSRTDPLETGSTVSIGTDVTSDISELDHSLQAHREQLEAEGDNPDLIGGAAESSTPLVTDSEDSNRDDEGLRQRKT